MALGLGGAGTTVEIPENASVNGARWQAVMIVENNRAYHAVNAAREIPPRGAHLGPPSSDSELSEDAW